MDEPEASSSNVPTGSGRGKGMGRRGRGRISSRRMVGILFEGLGFRSQNVLARVDGTLLLRAWKREREV
jgi:hypothetical protein